MSSLSGFLGEAEQSSARPCHPQQAEGLTPDLHTCTVRTLLICKLNLKERMEGRKKKERGKKGVWVGKCSGNGAVLKVDPTLIVVVRVIKPVLLPRI